MYVLRTLSRRAVVRRSVLSRLYSQEGQGVSSQGTGPNFPVWKSLAFTAICGAGLLYYFNHEKRRIEQSRKLEDAGVIGTPKLGGPLRLTDQHGNPFDSSLLKDRFMLVYFGFTHCPDVCPEELDKMCKIVDLVNSSDTNAKVLPIFVTVDPDRDGPKEIKEYLKDFVGLTGNKEDVKETAKKYRVYYRPARTGGTASAKDYLVDHSIFIFLIDPTGKYVTHFGRESPPERCSGIILDALNSWDLSQ